MPTPLSRLVLDCVEHLLPITEIPTDETPTNPDKNPTQTPENECDEKIDKTFPPSYIRNASPVEIDTLDNGRPAYDFGLAPAPKPNKGPIEIRVMDYLGDEPEVFLG